MSRSKTGKPVAKELAALLKKYPFEEGALGEPKGEGGYSEARLRVVVAAISEKIVDYLHRSRDEEVFELIRAKVGASELPALLERETHKDLLDAKTLQKVLAGERVSNKTTDILTAFQRVYEAEVNTREKLQRVAGVYNLYNTHTVKWYHYQISNLIIGDLGEARLRYLDRRFEEKEQPLEIEMVGNNKVMMALSDEDFRLIFYCFIGARGNPRFFQAAFLYNNDRGWTVPGLAVLEKVDGEKELTRPQRHLNQLPGATGEEPSESRRKIQQFLWQSGQPIKPLVHGVHPFDFSCGELPSPGPFHTQALFYKSFERSIIGEFTLYFNERFPSEKGFKGGAFSTVGLASLSIYKNDISGVLECRMRSKKNQGDKELVHEGVVLNNQLKSDSNFILSLYLQPDSGRYLNLVFNLVNENLFIGTHNIMYTSPGVLGAGAVVMVRNSGTQKNTGSKQQELPRVINPLEYDYGENKLESRIINYLSRNSNSMVTAPAIHGLRAVEPLKYAGTYRLYSYGKDNNIRISAMKVYENGYVLHRSISGGKPTEAVGKAELIRSVLYVSLSNLNNNRTGFFSIKVEEVAPAINETMYGGTFTGVTRRKGEFPLYSVLILEYLGMDIDINADAYKPKLCGKETWDDEKIPPAVQRIFAGKESVFRVLPGHFDQEHWLKYAHSLPDYGTCFRLAAIEEALEKEKKNMDNRYVTLAKAQGVSDIEEQIEKAKQERARVLFERACFHAFFEEDEKKAESLLSQAQRLYSHEDWLGLFSAYQKKTAL